MLRLECSIDCISGLVGQWVTNKIFSVHSLAVSVSFEEEKISKKINLQILTTLGISRHFKIILLILMKKI